MKDGIKSGLQDFSGALGDLGTFLPLALGLIAVNGLNATAVFLSAGALYIAAGAYFRLPIPVQPLKATSAIAIAIGASADEIAATALLMGALFLGVSSLRIQTAVARIFTRPVVRGIQLGLSFVLLKGGWKLLAKDLGAGVAGPWGLSLPAGLLIGAVAAALVLLSSGGRRFPSALAAVLFGILCGLLSSDAGVLGRMEPGFLPIEPGLPLGGNFGRVVFVLLLPQIALTFANSVVATADACGRYYGDRAGRVTVRGLCGSLGIANLLSGLIGGIPMCHGSGGVTAHYRFGARTGRAGLLIGLLFVCLALAAGRSLAETAGLIPAPVLGVLLLYVGIEHAKLVRDVIGVPAEMTVAATVAALTLVTGNLAVGFAAGILLDLALRRLDSRRVAGKEPLRASGGR